MIALTPKTTSYIVIVEKADHNYSAYVPDLCGCVTTGETIAEIEKNIQEAIIGHLEVMREYGDSIPEPSSIHELDSPANIILQVSIHFD
ncbi:type II toxin-antitoxin system HicB family antitoxin [Dolichospermum sp. ST_con]|nr:type II toxin-antitoxin system HicB family antitoxin [Dolichospermum sp. ST_con]MDD1419603.1 type II toxin-antitoxin system HicB family antitoxin [Dolichospermum sp. ST_sed1]MDD1422913.1 type II toxin-antitoxin system HicB family antitoxin [Dolichospermum sp. ST_sed9]MDD1430668.1 type II toxin-antitoxin system HicB family antitoxin [Dolichospermum sp. ST_sed6]MDD1439462.1 type II toxin-antitoxin system HicB family antitoxin [Dolichospermum sp. ST_sed3]MDD1445843.1 type II toxin-antitoxin sy